MESTEIYDGDTDRMYIHPVSVSSAPTTASGTDTNRAQHPPGINRPPTPVPARFVPVPIPVMNIPEGSDSTTIAISVSTRRPPLSGAEIARMRRLKRQNPSAPDLEPTPIATINPAWGSNDTDTLNTLSLSDFGGPPSVMTRRIRVTDLKYHFKSIHSDSIEQTERSESPDRMNAYSNSVLSGTQPDMTRRVQPTPMASRVEPAATDRMNPMERTEYADTAIMYSNSAFSNAPPPGRAEIARVRRPTRPPLTSNLEPVSLIAKNLTEKRGEMDGPTNARLFSRVSDSDATKPRIPLARVRKPTPLVSHFDPVPAVAMNPANTLVERSAKRYTEVDGSISVASFNGPRAQKVSGPDVSIAQGLLVENSMSFPSQESSLQYGPSNMNRQSENLPPDNTSRQSRYNSTSNTWTSSSGEMPETDNIGDRGFYVDIYNKTAEKHGIPELVPDGYGPAKIEKSVITKTQDDSIMRSFLKRTVSILSLNLSKQKLKTAKSITDISQRVAGAGKDAFKDRHLAELVRLCGSSPLYLPSEYAPGTLSLPTCVRATAQYLVQNGRDVPGIFRVPGAHLTVLQLYNHYASQDEDGDVIDDTVRCPTLPESIQCDVHDVASTFKKFISGLPGGILGKPWLFDALVSIHDHDRFGADPELMRTKESKVKARLIASAIYSHSSRFQRDLICTVFGVLCMIGRNAEVARHEDEEGRPLPTNKLMGYGSLGTVFGPLLLGRLIDEYNPSHRVGSLRSSQGRASPKKRSRNKKAKSAEESLLESRIAAEKMMVAGRVMEMILTHWRDVVRQMKNLSNEGSSLVQQYAVERGQGKLPPSASESFFLLRPPNWEDVKSNRFGRGSASPTPRSQYPLRVRNNASGGSVSTQPENIQVQVERQRSRPRAQPSQRLSSTRSMSVLTPPREDSSEEIYQSLDCDYRAPNTTNKLVPGLPFTENKTISSGGSLHRDLLPSLRESSEDSRPLDIRLATTGPLFEEPLFRGDFFHVKRPAIGKGSQGTQRAINEEQREQLGDTITNTLTTITTAVNLDKRSTKIKETNIESDNKDATMYRKKKQPTIERGTSKTSESSQRSNAVHDLPPHVDRIPGQSPSEHLDRMLSANTAGSTAKNASEFRSTGSAYKSGGSHHLAAQPHESLNTSEGHSPRHKVQTNSVARVSLEKDMASLASLAEALKSESNDDFQSFDPSYNTTEFVSDDDIDYSPIQKWHNRRVRPEDAKPSKTNSSAERTFKAKPKEAREEQNEYPEGYLDLPPRPSITPRIRGRGHEGGIRSLIGKFNEADRDRSTSPSPPRSPAPGYNKYGAKVSTPVLPSCNMSSSPVLDLGQSIKLTAGFANEFEQQGINTEASVPRVTPTKVRTRIPRPKSMWLVSIAHNAEAQLQFPMLTPVKRYSDNTGISLGAGRVNTSVQTHLGQVSGGDSMEHTSTGSVLTRFTGHPGETGTIPRPQQSTPVSGSPKPSADPTSLHVSNNMDVKPITAAAVTSLSTQVLGPNSRRSLLFEHLKFVNDQLAIRTGEADNLRRQLTTKASLNDLSTLAEQLRESRRETALWRKRAEVAEGQLMRLAQYTPLVTGSVAVEQSASNDVGGTQVGMSRSPIADERDHPTLDSMAPIQVHDVDGATSRRGGSNDTQGTIMRTIPGPSESSERRGFIVQRTFERSTRESEESGGPSIRRPIASTFERSRATSEDLIAFSEADETERTV